MRLVIMLTGLAVAVSCGVESEPDLNTETNEEAATSAAESAEPMCDGSDALRFIQVTEGGGQSITPYYFTEPHGYSFFAVDGKCRYYVEDDYMRGIFTGTLTPDDAAQLSADMHWSELDGWVDLESEGSCFDASTATLIKPNAAVGCYCACKAAPMGLTEAMRNVTKWQEKMLEEGTPLDGPVGALIDTTSRGGPSAQPIYEWPLERSIDSIPDLLLEPLGDPRLVAGSDQWARFDDPEEFKKLRELRAEALRAKDESSGFTPAILIRDGNKLYDLYVRDEPQDGFEQAWNDLRDSAVPTP